MKVIQKEIRLQPKSRGFHLITSEIEAELTELKEISREYAVLQTYL